VHELHDMPGGSKIRKAKAKIQRLLLRSQLDQVHPSQLSNTSGYCESRKAATTIKRQYSTFHSWAKEILLVSLLQSSSNGDIAHRR
jgi:hypothetical protein